MTRMLSSQIWLALFVASSASAFSVTPSYRSVSRCPASAATVTTTTTTTCLSMGLLDSIGDFLQTRDDDFVKLEDLEEVFGPGPALILYNVPSTIDSDEIQDMLSDGAPQATKKGVTIARIRNHQDALLQLTLDESLQKVVTSGGDGKTDTSDDSSSSIMTGVARSDGCPVLFFSGFLNKEMMATYHILGEEIYQESGASAACAKAVPNSMSKLLGQVLEEITGDHKDATSGQQE